MSAELDRLRTLVNATRYRGIRGNEPMADFYVPPFSYERLEEIAEAALALVLAEERALSVSHQQNPEDAQPLADTPPA